MSPLVLFLFTLLFVSILLLWAVVFQHDRELQQFRHAQQVVHIYRRPHEIGEAHPFAPDAVLTRGDSVLSGREVVESSP